MELSLKIHSNLKLQLLKRIRFVMTSSIATVVDLGVYAFVIKYIYVSSFYSNSRAQMVIATAIGALCGMLVNFFLQKKYVFTLKGSVSRALLLSVIVSCGAIVLESLVVYFLSQIDLFHSSLLMKMIPKIIAMIIIFFYTYFFMSRVFEGD